MVQVSTSYITQIRKHNKGIHGVQYIRTAQFTKNMCTRQSANLLGQEECLMIYPWPYRSHGLGLSITWHCCHFARLTQFPGMCPGKLLHIVSDRHHRCRRVSTSVSARHGLALPYISTKRRVGHNTCMLCCLILSKVLQCYYNREYSIKVVTAFSFVHQFIIHQ